MQSCGSIWACPVCSAKIRARRSIEVEAAASRHVEQGGSLAMLTLTVRHEKRHGLVELIDGLRESWRAMQRRRRWLPVRARLVGTITSLEITVGPNGWHPHLHLLLFLDGDGGDVLEDVETWLPQAWCDTVAVRLDVAPDLAHGSHLMRLGASAAAYVTKIAGEATRADLKSDGSNPFGLLDGVEDGEAQAVAQWLEYVTGTRGRRAIVWSDGLRELLLPEVEEMSDEDLAAAEVGGELVQLLDGREWFRLAMRRTQAGVVSALALLEEWEERVRSRTASP